MTTKLRTLADALHQAEESRSPIEALSTSFPQLTLEDAYEIQLINAKRAQSSGRRLVGYKLGLTSEAAQKHFGVFEPDFGHLFADMCVMDAGVIQLNGLIAPKIEGELAFVLSGDLRGPNVTMVDVIRNVEYVMVSLEIIDSRIRDWKIGAVDTIADNGSSSRFVLGGKKIRLDELDLPSAKMSLNRNKKTVVTATGSAVMGNPLNAVVFLANELAKFGSGLEAGQVILSGSLGGMIDMVAGETYTCVIPSLGTVSVRAE